MVFVYADDDIWAFDEVVLCYNYDSYIRYIVLVLADQIKGDRLPTLPQLSHDFGIRGILIFWHILSNGLRGTIRFESSFSIRPSSYNREYWRVYSTARFVHTENKPSFRQPENYVNFLSGYFLRQVVKWD